MRPGLMKTLLSPRRAVAAPVASFTGTPTAISPGTPIVFTDASTGSPTTWSYAVRLVASGHAYTVVATTQNPSVTYETVTAVDGDGTYDVKLTVTNAAGSGSQERLGYLDVAGG